MSFSSYVKKEIISVPIGDRHCRLAMLAAVICGAAKVRPQCITLKTENKPLARMFYQLAKGNFSVKPAVRKREHNGSVTYTLEVTGGAVERMLRATGLWDDVSGYARRINAMTTRGECCRKAYLAGSILACGYLGDPNVNYHCEFIADDIGYALELAGLLSSFGLNPGKTRRAGRHGYVLYFKDGEQISDILKIIGAHSAMMRFENIRIRKDVDNKINRAVNCDSANMYKAMSAAIKQTEAINTIINATGLAALPEGLAAAAKVRLDYPEDSMKELGARLTPAVSKSGMSHRLHKLQEIADKIREDNTR